MSQILIVDDQPQNCQEIASMLDDLDITLMYCHKSENAIAHIREIEPSLVLLDADMPNMDGYQVINQMWSDDDLRQIPVLLMTSHFADRKQLLHQPLLEVVDALPKPINPEMLIDRVKMALTLKSHQQSIVSILDDGGQAIRKRHEGVLAVNKKGQITFANATALALLRTNHQMIFGVYLESIFEEPNHQVNSAWMDHPIQKVCSQGNVLQVEACVLYCADGTTIQVKMAAIPMPQSNDLSMVIAFRQIKVESEQSDEDMQQAYLKEYDSLTGTYCRSAFEQVIDDRLKQSQVTAKKMAVLQVDLSHFNHVNETLGHDVGDRMLKDVVSRIRKTLRPTDIIGRIGGDVFAVLIDDIQTHHNAGDIAQKVINALKESFLLEGFELYIGCNLGVATYPECGKDSASLLKNAAIAVEGAKLVGSNSYKFFTAKMNQEILERVQLEAALKRSLERGELVAELQHLSILKDPCHLFSQKNISELSISWNHSTFGVQDSSSIIDLFEKYNAINLLQEFNLSVIAAFFQQASASDVLMVPTSMLGLFSGQFISLLEKHTQGLSAQQLVWVFQEESFGRISGKLAQNLKELREKGYKLGLATSLGASLMKAFNTTDLDLVKFTQKAENSRQTILLESSQQLVAQMGVAVIALSY